MPSAAPPHVHAAMNEAWDEWVPAGHAPTRATVGVTWLADPGWKVCGRGGVCVCVYVCVCVPQ